VSLGSYIRARVLPEWFYKRGCQEKILFPSLEREVVL
jgi:hypothetical protein